MKEFFKIIRRFVSPYKRYLALNILFNILAAFLTLFSFAIIVPILEMLFEIKQATYSFIPWGSGDVKDVVINNFYYYTQEVLAQYGASATLAMLAVLLVIMTLFKTGATYLSSYFIVPMRSGIVRDIRNCVYDKIVTLPIAFFTSERKGDVIARMSGDVAEIESSIMASLDMMFKNPVMIIVCLIMMITVSWQLTVFVLVLLPIAGVVMGRVGKRLKRKSLEGQEQMGLIMSFIEETLSGLRIIKAFNAAKKKFIKMAKNDKTIYYYCAVVFDNGSNYYHYRTEDTSLKIGDEVVVPVGNNGEESVAQIVSIEQHSRLTVPYPVEKTKFIIRKIEEKLVE